MSTSTIVPNPITQAFQAWASSDDNQNRTCLSTEKYTEFITILTDPDAKPPPHMQDKLQRQKWSNSRVNAIRNYDLIDGKLWRMLAGAYQQW